MRNRFAAFAAVLALSCPAFATVLGNPPPAVYSCTGNTIFTIPFPYLAASQVIVTQTAAGITTTVFGTVKPSIAPTSGTLTLGTACPSGATLTISRSVPLTQPQSFRTGSYSGAAHEQAFDRLEMQIQQNANTHATDKAALAAKDTAQDAAIIGVGNSVAALNGTSHTVTDTSSVLAFGTTTPRTLTARFAESVNLKDFGAKGDGTTDDTAAIQAAINAVANGSTLLGTPGSTYMVGAAGLSISGRTNLRIIGNGATIKLSAAATPTVPAWGSSAIIIASSTGIVFSGWVLDGNAKDSNIIALSACTECEVSDNRLRNGGHLGQITSGVGGVRNRFLRNVVSASVGTARGMWIGNTSAADMETDPLVHGNTVYSNGASGIVVTSAGGRVEANLANANAGSGIVISGANGFPSHSLNVVANTCNANLFDGIQADMSTTTVADSAYDIKVIGNTTDGNTLAGIATVNGTNWIVEGNSTANNVTAGIQADRLTGGSISHNIVYDTRVGVARTQIDGIRLSAQTGVADITNVTIAGNVVYNNTSQGIRLQTSGTGTMAGVTLTGNSTTSNGATGIWITEATAGTITRLTLQGNYSAGNTTSDFRIDPQDVAFPPTSNSFTTVSGTKTDAFTFTDGATTPSVAGRTLFKANNTAATTITNFTNGTPGQIITVWFGSANTTVNPGGGITMPGGAGMTFPSDSFVTYQLNGGVWREVARGGLLPVRPGSVTFANLGTPANGIITYCSDCTTASTPCTGAGTGALAVRQNGAWSCK